MEHASAADPGLHLACERGRYPRRLPPVAGPRTKPALCLSTLHPPGRTSRPCFKPILSAVVENRIDRLHRGNDFARCTGVARRQGMFLVTGHSPVLSPTHTRAHWVTHLNGPGVKTDIGALPMHFIISISSSRIRSRQPAEPSSEDRYTLHFESPLPAFIVEPPPVDALRHLALSCPGSRRPRRLHFHTGQLVRGLVFEYSQPPPPPPLPHQSLSIPYPPPGNATSCGMVAAPKLPWSHRTRRSTSPSLVLKAWADPGEGLHEHDVYPTIARLQSFRKAGSNCEWNGLPFILSMSCKVVECPSRVAAGIADDNGYTPWGVPGIKRVARAGRQWRVFIVRQAGGHASFFYLSTGPSLPVGLRGWGRGEGYMEVGCSPLPTLSQCCRRTRRIAKPFHIAVGMEFARWVNFANSEREKTGDPRENPPTSGIFLSRFPHAKISARPLHVPVECLSPTKTNHVRFSAGSRRDLSMWESCRIMSLVGGFSRGSPVLPVLVFQRCSPHLASHSSALKTSISLPAKGGLQLGKGSMESGVDLAYVRLCAVFSLFLFHCVSWFYACAAVRTQIFMSPYFLQGVKLKYECSIANDQVCWETEEGTSLRAGETVLTVRIQRRKCAYSEDTESNCAYSDDTEANCAYSDDTEAILFLKGETVLTVRIQRRDCTYSEDTVMIQRRYCTYSEDTEADCSYSDDTAAILCLQGDTVLTIRIQRRTVLTVRIQMQTVLAVMIQRRNCAYSEDTEANFAYMRIQRRGCAYSEDTEANCAYSEDTKANCAYSDDTEARLFLQGEIVLTVRIQRRTVLSVRIQRQTVVTVMIQWQTVLKVMIQWRHCSYSEDTEADCAYSDDTAAILCLQGETVLTVRIQRRSVLTVRIQRQIVLTVMIQRRYCTYSEDTEANCAYSDGTSAILCLHEDTEANCAYNEDREANCACSDDTEARLSLQSETVLTVRIQRRNCAYSEDTEANCAYSEDTEANCAYSDDTEARLFLHEDTEANCAYREDTEARLCLQLGYRGETVLTPIICKISSLILAQPADNGYTHIKGTAASVEQHTVCLTRSRWRAKSSSGWR
ncbi:hypothetical protein PR048_010305 [Dryococelus australis]|uniref:Uncharacterized protein n=1 Tax=Dryococelus australis TaxID=614101 RepID=A0ABQ9I368_9NEOP|nr:hypothetical protein PR048_010305 [Dryococelus australis]